MKTLIEQFPHLTSIKGITDYREEKKVTKKNLIADLKKHFPNQKFSVTNPHASTFYIKWTNGVSLTEVEKVTSKFESYENDITGDFRDFNPSEFNREFGGFKYIFETREYTEEVYKPLVTEMEKLFTVENGFRFNEAKDYFYKIWRKTSIPLNAFNFKLGRTEQDSGLIEDIYKIDYQLS